MSGSLRIIPSIASSDLAALGREAERVREMGYLHVDIEDGNFSPGMTFGPDTVARLRAYTDSVFDVHLMVTRPQDMLEEIRGLGVERIAVQAEASAYPSRLLNTIRGMGMRAGLALNYKTAVEVLERYTDLLDYVLLLTNESDCAGLAFKPQSLERIRRTRALLDRGTELWVDGGVTEALLPLVREAGADVAIMGRAIFGAQDAMARYRQLTAAAQERGDALERA